MTEFISTDSFRALFGDDSEFAVIDPRDASSFAGGHLLAASNLPLSDLEARIKRAVPHLQAPCILCDDGGGEAERAAQLLTSLGYQNVLILHGGVAGWEAAGGTVFTGSSVPGKAFGEFVESSCSTPAMIASGAANRCC
jgi:rhodanese-related sulfurtransferase